MEGDGLTIAVLREIRDEIRETRVDLSSRIDGTNARIDQTNERLGETNQRLGVVEDTLKDLAGQQLMLTRDVKNVAERHGGQIDGLDDRVTKLETKLDT